MAQATGSRVQLGYIAEVTYGTTPDTPSLQAIEFSSFSGDLAPTTLNDTSINPNRQKASARRGNVSAEGSLEVLLCAENYDALLESALMSTWATDVLKVGTTRKSFAIEQTFTDLGQYRVFNGMVVDSLKVSATTGDYVKASFGLKGTTATALTGTSVDADAYTAVTPKSKFFHEGGVFKEGGTTIAYLSAIEFDLANQFSTNFALGETGARDVTAGMVQLTGKVTALFESSALYNKFVNNTSTSLEFTLSQDSESLTFLMPKVVYTKGSIPVQGDGPLVVELEFEAIYDTTEATALKVTRV